MRASLTSLLVAIALVFTSLMGEHAPRSWGEQLRLRSGEPGGRPVTVARSPHDRLQLCSARHGKRGQLPHAASYLLPLSAWYTRPLRHPLKLELPTAGWVWRRPAPLLAHSPRAPPFSA